MTLTWNARTASTPVWLTDPEIIAQVALPDEPDLTIADGAVAGRSRIAGAGARAPTTRRDVGRAARHCAN
jgi:hypothetical protein